MWFLLQLLISYSVALVIGSIIVQKGLSDIWTVIVTYGIVASPFALVAAALARLLERTIGWPAMLLVVVAIHLAMFLVSPSKRNFAAGFNFGSLSFEFLFVAVWCFLTWRYRGTA